jgi:CheY-like chemotaxis protein
MRDVLRHEKVTETQAEERHSDAHPNAPPARRARRVQALRVLLVDDNADYVDLMAMALQCHGHAVMTLYDGLAALHAAPGFRPDVVLLDLGLPGLDGFGLARALRSDVATRNTLLVAVSGYGSERDLARSRAAGIDLHLLKPVTLAQIEDALAGTRRGPPWHA